MEFEIRPGRPEDAGFLGRRTLGRAKEQGCVAARLTAGEQAAGLYRSLGFEDGRELILKLG